MKSDLEQLKRDMLETLESRIKLEMDMVKASVKIEIAEQLKMLRAGNFRGLI